MAGIGSLRPGSMDVVSLLSIAFLSCTMRDEKAGQGSGWLRIPVSIELRLAKSLPAPGLMPAAVYGERDTVYLHPKTQLSNKDIARVETVNQPDGLGLQVWLTGQGVKRMSKLTAAHTGDRLAILIDSEVVSVPLIAEALQPTTGTPNQIELHLQPEEASELAKAVSETWPVAAAK